MHARVRRIPIRNTITWSVRFCNDCYKHSIVVPYIYWRLGIAVSCEFYSNDRGLVERARGVRFACNDHIYLRRSTVTCVVVTTLIRVPNECVRRYETMWNAMHIRMSKTTKTRIHLWKTKDLEKKNIQKWKRKKEQCGKNMKTRRIGTIALLSVLRWASESFKTVHRQILPCLSVYGRTALVPGDTSIHGRNLKNR